MKVQLRASLFLALALVVPACGPGTQTKTSTIASAPTTLLATPVTTGRIDLTWTSTSSNEFEFRIERSTLPTSNFLQVGTAPKGSQAYSDLGLLPGTTYYYRISAWNSKGYSPYAGPTSAMTTFLLWNQSTGGPGIRAEHSAIYDSLGRRMILFGGLDDFFSPYNDLWALDLTPTTINMTSPPTDYWSPLSPAGTPPTQRFGHSAIYDGQNNRMIVFGGVDTTNQPQFDVYILTLGSTPTWSTASVSGTPPTPRFGHTAVYDAANQRMVVFGGYDNIDEMGDCYLLTLPLNPPFAWSSGPAGPMKRTEHCAVYDGLRQEMVVFGGLDREPLPDGSDLNAETWTLSLRGTPTWTQHFFSATPLFREGHTAVYDSANQRTAMFGGDTTLGPAPTSSSEFWSLRFDTAPTWTFLAPSSGSPPVARFGHTAVYDSGTRRIIIYGGYDNSGFPSFQDTWLSDF